MKFIRYEYRGDFSCGLLVDETTVRLIDGDIFQEYEVLDQCISIDSVNLLAPVVPGKVLALGYNYKDLVGEKEHYDEPVIFLKPPSSVLRPRGEIRIPKGMKVWTEVELAIVIGKQCSNVTSEEASGYIFGYTIANDVTAENILGRDHHLARSKAWDSFCPLGPAIETDINTDSLVMRNRINGQVSQESSTGNRILNDSMTVSLISRMICLEPGDIILTGTPANAEQSIIREGDTVSLEIENIGVLENKVREIGNES